ncbi:LysR family transcriptional regulator [Achromobacter xylosoxidans]|uniref:LysR family transcriptional regulator n=1 Tax=Alcaligenes xylosoxydans xylosoxydans TaxID=85698 RepID=UPI001562F4B9|nr:LysR family transcriptional regulator [Achromobacter xylosoxidans]QKI68649.1 LysR family transcriptional regulator [Achromobacter xylosoxidans]
MATPLPHDRLGGIEVFVQAAEAGSFALAAERLSLTRSAVGKSIARLEARLGARLFHRTTRQQSLTDAGQAYYDRCVRALAELYDAEAELDSGRRSPQGRLRVSAPVVFGRHCVAPVLRELAARHPQLQIEISFNDRVVDLIEEGYDLGIRIGALPDSASLVARRLGLQTMGIGASPAYIAAHGRPQTLDEMRQHVGVAYARGGVEKGWSLMEADGEVVQLRVPPRLRMDDLQAIADAAIAGAGLAWLPCWMLSHYVRTGELDVLMHGDRMAAQPVHAVWPQARYLPSKTRTAIDALAERVPAMLAMW